MRPKVIVLGLDGLEPSIVEAMLDRGELPNFTKLRERGSYRHLATTYPAQTPVAWSSFVTGTNPGGHGIFDFVRRNPSTYQLDFALNRFEKPRNFFSRPRVVNSRGGTPIWTWLSEAGVPSTVLRCPVTFPPEALKGRMLSGVGVPDLRGSQGKGTFYTQDPKIVASESEQVVHINGDDPVRTLINGPFTAAGAGSTCELLASHDRASNVLTLRCGDSRIALAERTWSPWLRVKFSIAPLKSVQGLVRFYLVRLEPILEFYASPVNFDPEAPPFPISAPPEYAADLSREIGLYSTIGMAEDHSGFNNGRFDADAYSQQCNMVFAERERMTFYELNRFTEGLLFVVFDTPDRVNHMFWGYRDPRHPSYADPRAQDLARRIDDCYIQCDRLLGRILDAADDQTLLIVLSDHGCSDFRRAFHLNAWLREQGLLAFADSPAAEARPLSSVNWQKTHAYAVGFGGIYLNLKGREERGIVSPGTAAERVRRAICNGLTGLGDAQSGDTAIHGVNTRAELYSGPHAVESPDLVINFAPGFRASWQTALGNTPATLYEDNLRRWSGDHLIDPACVPGVLLMNRVSQNSTPAIIDLAPTILRHLRVPVPETLEGVSLLE